VSVERFFIKRASLATILPSVAGPAIGGFAGKALGPRLGLSPDIGALLGGVTGGVTGGLLREKAEASEAPAVPPGAPFAIDSTTADIPPWAVQGAQLMQPKMKQAHEGLRDVVLGDALGPLYPLGQGIKNHDMGGAAKGILGQGAGVIGGGLLGHGAGALIDKFVGHQVNVPGVNMPLSTLLSGLGATVGSVKGLNLARGSAQGA
jgi:hypothetical protein